MLSAVMAIYRRNFLYDVYLYIRVYIKCIIYIYMYIYIRKIIYIYINIMYDTCKYISSFLSYEKLDLFYESMYHTYSGKRRVFPALLERYIIQLYTRIIIVWFYILYIFFCCIILIFFIFFFLVFLN